MKFFEAVPGELFSPLASPNRALYAEAESADRGDEGRDRGGEAAESGEDLTTAGNGER